MAQVGGSARSRWLAAAVTALAASPLTLLLSGGASAAPAPARSTPPPAAGARTAAARAPADAQQSPPVPSQLLSTDWLVGRSAINLIDTWWGNDTLAMDAFDRPGTGVMFGRPSGWLSETMESFDAVGPVTYQGSFLYDLSHRLIPAGTKAVLLDLEDWSLSQNDEERDPGYFMDEFVTKAHLHGYKAILAPGIDLTRAMRCEQPDQPSFRNYLVNCDLPRLVGQAKPDVYMIQAQAYENNTSLGSNCFCYSWFVDSAAAQARQVDGGLEAFATLSSNPEGRTTTPQVLYTDTIHSRATVSGYSLNVPRRSIACPTCTIGGDPDVAAEYLYMLGYPGKGARAAELQSYWLAARDGEVFAAGAALPLGGIRTPASNPVIGIAATADRRGYWIATADGGVTAFGDARFVGDLPERGVKVSDIVALAPTPDRLGYWLIGRDGGEFAFGDARYYGSLPGKGVHVSDIVGMASTATGRGYWLVGRDGGTFAFGDAAYHGSLPGRHIAAADITAMIPAPARTGYVLVGRDGGTFVFGTGVSFFGSLPGRGVHVRDVVGLALTRDGTGYWLAGANGEVWEFGDAESFTFVQKPGVISPVVAIAAA